MELALPEIVADHHHRRSLASSLRLNERLAQNGLQPGDIEVLARHYHTLHRLAAVVAHQEVEGPAIGSYSGERLRLLLPFCPLQGCPALPRWVSIRPDGMNQSQLFGQSIRRRRQQNPVNQAEDRRGGTDAKCQSKHGNQCEPRLSQQRAPSEPKILSHRLLLVLISVSVSIGRCAIQKVVRVGRLGGATRHLVSRFSPA
jgi:hypothetical protein